MEREAIASREDNPMSRVARLFRRAKQIYHTEGLRSLMRRVFAFLLDGLFKYETYYLYETDILMERSESDFLPRIPTFTMHIVGTNKEAEELEADGLEFRSYVSNAGERLEKGATAFCFFFERELANIAWVALTEEAFKTFNEPPMKVDFAIGEA